MKRSLSIFLILISSAVHAQDGAMEGIDAYFLEPGYYDNLSDALADPEGALYLDLSLQSPKLSNIPEGVYSLVNLKYLELGFNQIAELDDGISKLQHLEVIGLDGNKYLKSISANVYILPSLKELHLKNTGLSSEQLDAVNSRMPASCALFR